MPDWDAIAAQLGTGDSRPQPVSGGDISAAWRLSNLFLKTGPLSSLEMFAAEADGLRELASANAVRVPEVVGVGECPEGAWIALEWIDMQSPTEDAHRRFGEQLAELHSTTNERYGWHRDNTIGLTPQYNEWSDNWVEFFREHRLGFQLRLAHDNGFGDELTERGDRLLRRLPIWLQRNNLRPSLLHGDLWGGNWAVADGMPVIYDPAVYFGDPETDLAMTRLFGGFSAGFYAAYERSAPLASGHQERMILYQLYHILNHLNLFGSGYLSRAQQLIDRLI